MVNASNWNWSYLYVGMVAGGLPNLKLHPSDSIEYLTKLVALTRTCDKINFDEIDSTLLARYMSKEQLEADILEIFQLYEQASVDHRDTLLQVKLGS